MMSGPVVSIVMPVRNEGLNLRIMLKILNAVVDVSHEVLVVVDAHDDASIPVVEEASARYAQLAIVNNTRGRGVLNALRAGVDAAHGRYILIFAADEVGPVLAIDDMIALMDGGCEFVSCTRYAHGGRRLGGSWVGGLLSRAANRLFRWFSGCQLTDATTGIKMFTREVFHRLDLEARPVGWAVAFEMAIKAQLAGLRLGEVPIVSIDRLYGGKSTFRLGPWTVEYLRWFVWGLTALRNAPESRPVAVRIPAATAALGGKVQM
jgi:dolichol-phosphate mannosyltransferase